MQQPPVPSLSLAAADARYGEVFDRGYAHYDGKRLGRRHAWWALTVYSMKRAMGIRKSWTAKIIPFLLYLAAIIPAIVMIGLVALVPRAEIASYPQYFEAIVLIAWIFAATVAPEMLCVDRREHTLPFYFARSITRFDYVFAKLAATILLMATLTVLPVVILWLGRQLVADSPGQAMRTHLDDLGKVVLIGVMLALVAGVAGLAVSSITPRKAVAVAIIVIGYLMLTSIAHAAFAASDGNWRRYLIFMSPIDLFLGLIEGLFPSRELDQHLVGLANFPIEVYLLYMIALAVIGVLFIRWRYAPND